MSDDLRLSVAFVAALMPGVLAGIGVFAWLTKRKAYGDYPPIVGNPEEIQRLWTERWDDMERRTMRAWRVALIACPVLFVVAVSVLLFVQ